MIGRPWLLGQFYAHPFKLEHMDLLDSTLLLCLFCIVWISMAFEIALKETIEYEVLEGMAWLVQSPQQLQLPRPSLVSYQASHHQCPTDHTIPRVYHR